MTIVDSDGVVDEPLEITFRSGSEAKTSCSTFRNPVRLAAVR